MNNKTTDKYFFLTGLAAWRTQRRRRIQVICALASLALYLSGALLGFPIASLFGLMLFLVVAGLLRITTNNWADLPGSALDERQLAVRNAIYVAAYRVTGALYAVLAIICIVLTWFDHSQISTAAALQTLLGALFIAIVTPSCLLAWTEREA